MPGPYTYKPNIPQATDQISVSQGDLLTNFQSIGSFVDINHVDFASADAGKHFRVDFPSQASAVTSAGTDITLSNAASGGVQELYISKSAGTPIPFTQNNAATNGWTYLPSGLKIAWMKQTVVNGLNTFNLAGAAFGANWPGFVAGSCFSAQITPFNNNNTYIMGVTISALTHIQIDFYVNNIGISGGQVYMTFIGL